MVMRVIYRKYLARNNGDLFILLVKNSSKI